MTFSSSLNVFMLKRSNWKQQNQRPMPTLPTMQRTSACWLVVANLVSGLQWRWGLHLTSFSLHASVRLHLEALWRRGTTLCAAVSPVDTLGVRRTSCKTNSVVLMSITFPWRWTEASSVSADQSWRRFSWDSLCVLPIVSLLSFRGYALDSEISLRESSYNIVALNCRCCPPSHTSSSGMYLPIKTLFYDGQKESEWKGTSPLMVLSTGASLWTEAAPFVSTGTTLLWKPWSSWRRFSSPGRFLPPGFTVEHSTENLHSTSVV